MEDFLPASVNSSAQVNRMCFLLLTTTILEGQSPGLIVLASRKSHMVAYMGRITLLQQPGRLAAMEARDQSESMSGAEESIEQLAAAHRERLRALKAAQDLLNTPDDDSSAPVHSKTDESDTNDEQNNLNMKFRNYLPHDKQLQGGKLAPPVMPKFEDPVATLPVPEERSICKYRSKKT